MKPITLGDKHIFALEYVFLDDSRETELSLYINDNNILAFTRDGERYTTRWNLDDIALWLRDFIDNMTDDPFPGISSAKHAALMDEEAREFDSDDDDVFDEYYQKLYEWDSRHCWHGVSNGAILANVFFRQMNDNVEISWNNTFAESYVEFVEQCGSALINKTTFVEIVNKLLKAYAEHWF